MGFAIAARAHGPDAGGAVDVRLDPLAPELAGVRAQVHRTVAQQLVVENATDRVLEVLDERGEPFLWIGPSGVEGNLSAPAWHRGYAPDGRVPPTLVEEIRSGKPPEARWVRARREPNWGWFDARLEPPQSDVAHARFEVPVRIGGVASALRGRFVAQAKRTGALSARLLSAPDLAPGVRISLVPGRVGSFLLQSSANDAVTVLGRDGEPFVRLSPDGVDANLHSATFAEAARLRGGGSLALEPNADAPPRWQRLSNAPSYGWVDLRTAYPESDVSPEVATGGKRVELLRWVVPVRIGRRRRCPDRARRGRHGVEAVPRRAGEAGPAIALRCSGGDGCPSQDLDAATLGKHLPEMGNPGSASRRDAGSNGTADRNRSTRQRFFACYPKSSTRRARSATRAGRA